MNHFITLKEAIEMTRLYREQRNALLREGLGDKNILPFSETFDRAAFDALLAQPGCTALRIYYGMDPTLKVHAITVGVNAKNEDLLPGEGNVVASATEEEPPIVEAGTRCPEDCPPPSLLNP